MPDATQILNIAEPVLVSLIQFFKDRHAADPNAPIPTLDEVKAHLNANVGSLINQIDAWESQHPA